MRTSLPRLLRLLALPVVLSLLVVGCQDPCDGVLCSPAPIPLEVFVSDTVSVDTTLTFGQGQASIDTVLVVRRNVNDAVVTLRSVSGTDTTVFETLPENLAGYYHRLSVEGLPGVPFVIVAERKGRFSSAQRAEVRTVAGCCPTTLVGHFDLAIRQQ